MLYLKRKIDFFLSAWKSNPDRKPLIVKGGKNRIHPAVWRAKL